MTHDDNSRFMIMIHNHDHDHDDHHHQHHHSPIDSNISTSINNKHHYPDL